MDLSDCVAPGSIHWFNFSLSFITSCDNSTKVEMLRNYTDSITFKPLIIIAHNFFEPEARYTFYITLCTHLQGKPSSFTTSFLLFLLTYLF